MNGLFVFVLLVILGLLVWSMIAPNKLAKRLGKSSPNNLSRKHFGIVFGVIAVLLFVLVGITAPKQTTPVKTVRLTTVKSTSTTPQITYNTVTQTKSIPFTSTTVQDSNLAQGTNQVTTAGVNGVETLIYQDTYTNGKQTAQKLISDNITSKPVAQITSDGTYVAPAPAQSTPSSTSTSSCYPTASTGNCYEPGEYCSDADHGMSGVAGDGKSITCEDNDGWRWEP
jgi:hypothetical protein